MTENDSPLFLGIDGGGSSVRVVIADESLQIRAEISGKTANPNVAGWETARATIQQAIRSALDQAGCAAQDIRAASAGIAGAEASRAGDWVRSVLGDVLPNALLVPAGDHEIALIGAHGQRRGVLILAGTGSVAYGIDDKGETILIGGWGYLLGDEGSGYWLGIQALQAVVRHMETRGCPTSLTAALLDATGLTDRDSIITWTYSERRNREIARLAPIVLTHAEQGDSIANSLVDRAAYDLALMVATVYHRLDMPDLPLAFAGSLLLHENILQQKLCDRLKLTAPPVPRHSAVIGAAIHARDTYHTQHK